MIRAVFTLAVSACACAIAREIETTDWGMCWRRPDRMSNTVASKNTPGSDEFSNYRLTDPVYYAWLDGFDARHRVAQCNDNSVIVYYGPTNEYGDRQYYVDIATNALHRVTNTTYRLAFFDSMKERSERLRHLDTWPDPLDHGYEYSGNKEYWGSSFMDAVAPGPKRHDFDWTKDIVREFFDSSFRTAWFSNFRTLKDDTVFSPRYPYGFLDGDFANDLVKALTFNEPPLIQSEYWRVGSECTPYSFMTIMTNAYENVEATNLVYNSRRLVVGEMAARNQTLALFDKRVRSGYSAYVCTNEVVTSYRHILSSDIVYDGTITVTVDGSGNFSATPLDKSVYCEGISASNIVSVTNIHTSFSSPLLHATRPTYTFGASLILKNNDDGLVIDETGGMISDYLNAKFYELGLDECDFWCSVTINGGGNDSYLDIFSGDHWWRPEEFPFRTSTLEPGTYTPKGHASLSASYTVYDVSHVYNLNRPLTLKWPADKTYLSTNHVYTTVGTSFAASHHATDYTSVAEGLGLFSICFFEYGSATQDWYERIDYGYKSKTYDTEFRSEVDAGIYSELRNIVQKLSELDPGTSSPELFTGMSQSDLDDVCLNADGWNLNTRSLYFGKYEENPEEAVRITIRRISNGKFRYKIQGDTDFKDRLDVFSSMAWLDPCVNPLAYDYGWSTNAFYFTSKNQIVQEAKFDFPQVRLKDKIQ